MPFEKTIHFRGKDGVKLKLTSQRGEGGIEELELQLDGEIKSKAEYPVVLIPRADISDFWDLVRENIVAVGTGKQDHYLKCRILHEIQKQL